MGFYYFSDFVSIDWNRCSWSTISSVNGCQSTTLAFYLLVTFIECCDEIGCRGVSSFSSGQQLRQDTDECFEWNLRSYLTSDVR